MTIPTPILDIYESDLDSLIQEVAGVPHPHCVTGQGYGSRDAQQKWSAMDLSWKGPWFEEVLTSIPGGFCDPTAGNLPALTQAQYNDRQVDIRYKAAGEIGAIRPNPGDYIRLWLDDESSYRLLQIQDLEVSPTGKVTLQLGKRAFDEIDAFNARKSLGNAYLDQYFTESGNSISNSGTLTIGDDNLGWGSGWAIGPFTIPAGVNTAANHHRVTMDVSLSLKQGIWQAESFLRIDNANGTLVNGFFPHYLLGDTVTGINVTDWVNYGSATTGWTIYIATRGVWNSQPAAQSVSATFHAWRRQSFV